MRYLLFLTLPLQACAILGGQAPVAPICNKKQLVVVDNDASPVMDRVAVQAMGYWNRFWMQAYGHEIFIDAGRANLYLNDRPAVAAIKPMLLEEVQRLREENSKTSAYVKWHFHIRANGTQCIMGSTVVVKDTGEYDEHMLTKIVIHELGHALGLMHSDREFSAMHKKWDRWSVGPSEVFMSKHTYQAIQKLYGRVK